MDDSIRTDSVTRAKNRDVETHVLSVAHYVIRQEPGPERVDRLGRGVLGDSGNRILVEKSTIIGGSCNLITY